MIDFTGVTAIAIPEGNVTKIENDAGEVLWEKAVGGEYTFVDCIQLAANETLKTAILPNCGDYVFIDFAPTVSTSYSNFIAAGSSKVMKFWADGTKIFAKIDWYNQSFALLTAGERLTAAMSAQKILHNGTQVIDMGGVPAFTADTPLVIGGVPMQLYGCRHGASAGVLDMDYVPAIRNIDGAAGLYDNVTGTFVVIGTAVG